MRPEKRYQFTAECQHCNPGDPLIYDSESERDDETQKHADQTGHLLAIGYIDHEEDQFLP